MPSELDEARTLIDQGVPVFTAPQGAGNREFYFPTGWTDITPGHHHLDSYSETGALLIATGHRVDVIDIDPKNNADVHDQIALAAQYGIPILGHVVTPSAGAHLYIPSTGLSNAAVHNAGVDYRGIGGMVFAPGTHRGKYAGGGYVWLRTIDWTALAEWEPHRNEIRARVENYLTHIGWENRQANSTSSIDEDIDDVPVRAIPAQMFDDLNNAEGPWTMADGSLTTDRSSKFQSFVSSCYAQGMTFAQTVTLLKPWCNRTGKFEGRIARETLRSWRVCQDRALDEWEKSSQPQY